MYSELALDSRICTWASVDSGLAEWLETLGLLRVDAPTTMLRGAPLAHPDGGPRLFGIVTQAFG